MLSGVARRLTRDAETLNGSQNTASWPVRLFTVDPFTEGSYLLCIRLTVAYPILSIFVNWLLGCPG
ncbi:MAG: hypothetical protein WA970_03270 [Gammaproteobacteria bacterium]